MQSFFDKIIDIGKILGSLTTIIGFITLVLWKPVIKPMRDKRVKAKADKAEAENTFRTSMLSFAESVEKRITDIERLIDDNEKDRIRYEVLDFANSCRNKRRHTKDEFDHIIELNEKYVKLLKKTGDTNGKFTLEYEYIEDLYRKCQQENDFL